MSQWISPRDAIRTQNGQPLVQRSAASTQRTPPTPAPTGQSLYPNSPPASIVTPQAATANRPPRQYIVPGNPTPPAGQTRAAWPEASASAGVEIVEIPIYAGQLDGKPPETAEGAAENAENAEDAAPLQETADSIVAPVLSPEAHEAAAQELAMMQEEEPAPQEEEAPISQNQVVAIYGIDPSDVQQNPMAHASCDTVRSVEARLLALEGRILELEGALLQPNQPDPEPYPHIDEGSGDNGDDDGISVEEYLARSEEA